MKISTKGRYALRMMVDIAQCDSQSYLSLRDVSVRQEISLKYMEQIVSQLTKAGFLQSIRGPQGGYRLARRPEEYTVGEILRVTEGSLAPVVCLDAPTNTCPMAGVCPTLDFWEGFYRHMTQYLNGTTLHDLLCNAEVKTKATLGTL